MTAQPDPAQSQRTGVTTVKLSAEAYEARLLALLADKDSAGVAVRVAAEAVTHYPLHTGILVQAEAAMFNIGMKKESAIIAAFAVKHGVANADLMVTHANNLWQQGDIGQAEDVFKQAIESEPTHALSYFRFACLRRDQKRYAEAAQLAARATDVQPNIGLYWRLRGHICRDQGDEEGYEVHRLAANRIRAANRLLGRQYG